jgi:hypothetical protein
MAGVHVVVAAEVVGSQALLLESAGALDPPVVAFLACNPDQFP